MRSAEMSWQYIAGFFDGEGHFGISKYDNTKYNGGAKNKGVRAIIAACQMTANKKVLQRISRFLSKHKIQHCVYDCKYIYKDHCAMSWVKMGHKTHLKKFLKETLPYLIVKRKIGLQILKFCEKK